MTALKYILCLIIVVPYILYGQVKISKIETESTYEYNAKYNSENNHILFSAIKIDSNTNSFNEVSVRVKNMNNGKETVIIPNIYFSDPEFQWIDSSHVFYKISVAEEKAGLFGPWVRYLIKHNIYTQKKDTIESSWYNSTNYVRNLYVKENKLFYTLSYKEEVGGQWIECSLETNKKRTILSYSDKRKFKILTCQYLSNKEEMVYIMEDEDIKEIINLNLLNGTKKKLKTLNKSNGIESSCIINNNLYYLERQLVYDDEGVPDIEKSIYVINSINIYSGKFEKIFSFDLGLEVSNICFFQGQQILVSVSGNVDENMIRIPIDLKAGGSVSIELDPTSYLFVLDFAN